MSKPAAIITSYHFGPSNEAPWSRLLASLKASLVQLGDSGRLILVANGTEQGCASTGTVTKELEAQGYETKTILPVELGTNRRNVGSLNAGVHRFLVDGACDGLAFLASVQSSAVVKPGWLSKLVVACDGHAAAHGLIVDQDDESRVFARGHYLDGFKTKNHCYRHRTIPIPTTERGGLFPCLSACLFSREAVQGIVTKYGNFVCEHLEHYGDCTDVQARLRHLNAGQPSNKFVEEAVATKRWPTLHQRKAFTSQIVAGHLYRDKTLTEAIKAASDVNNRQLAEDARARALDIIASCRMEYGDALAREQLSGAKSEPAEAPSWGD